MKKIVHLSDTHIGYEDLEDHVLILVDELIHQLVPASDYVVVHTGDLVDNAFEDGAYERGKFHLDRLRNAGFTVLQVPGNHDYGNGSLGSAELVPKFKSVFFGQENYEFPCKTIVDEIAFIGLDSMAQELHWYDALFAEGELGGKQLNRLDQLLCFDTEIANAKYRVVYLHHHPFHPRPFHYLKDSEELKHVLQEHSIDALLFGHNHEGGEFHGQWDIPRVYDAGSSTSKKGSAHPIRVIDLSAEPGQDRVLEIKLEKLKPDLE